MPKLKVVQDRKTRLWYIVRDDNDARWIAGHRKWQIAYAMACFQNGAPWHKITEWYSRNV